MDYYGTGLEYQSYYRYTLDCARDSGVTPDTNLLAAAFPGV
jgi:hypothetical protein